ncbi:MAG TPA: hypothetical protein VJP82_04245 [Sphingomicrobium sp.]|jgi:hypothetical protein|nr:hypothetical protein [Sphingomicrobium sp.]
MRTSEHRREEVRAVRASRARTAELLGHYPQLSDADRREVLTFLQTARHLDIGLLSANDNLRPKLDAFMDDHRTELGVTPREAFTAVALIAGFLLACWLLWTVVGP